MTKLEIPHYDDPADLIRTINPGMSAEQALAQVQEYYKREYNPSQLPTQQARKKRLEESGYNPNEWTFFSNIVRLDGQNDDDVMRFTAKNFPEDIEFLLIQGEFIGGIMSNGSGAKYIYNPSPNDFSAFIRIRPKQLQERGHVITSRDL